MRTFDRSFFAGSFVGFIALLSVVVVAMRGAGLLETIITPEHLQDIGKFLFAFTAFWAYIAFSQFFLMWYANMPEETIFYKADKHRSRAEGCPASITRSPRRQASCRWRTI